MLDFYKTKAGRIFFDGQVPAFLDVLKQLATAAEQIAERLQQPRPATGPYAPMEIDIDPSWWEENDDPELWGRYFLCAPSDVGGPGLSVRGAYRYHVNAYRVAAPGERDKTHQHVQAAANPAWDEEFDAIWTAAGAEGRLTTIEIDGHECIMVITPYG